ncbi:hypothetical protein [Mesorhizobium sp. M0118]|uniref:hypothetical protein n=1 Tax=Mesorhizobium sp. M0118 TaxID=2956884 RepID=UPI00333BE4DF
MTIGKWENTEFIKPSPSHRGEDSPEAIYVEVGRALGSWEHMESAFARMFQVFCESRSLAACRAYGMIESSFTKHQALRQATDTFFAKHKPFDTVNSNDTKAILSAYQSAFQIRNNIAHGITTGYNLSEDRSHSGYFLCPPSYASKKVKLHELSVVYLEGANYFYTAADLKFYSNRFVDILNEAVRLAHTVNDNYHVIPPGELHP